MFSSLRINAICALIPCEETKNSAFVFSVFALMLLRSSLKVILLFMLLVESVLTARNISLCPSLLSGSLKQLDYKVNSTGTEDKSILLKLVSVVHLFQKIKNKIKKKSNLASPVPAGLLPLLSESVFSLLSSFNIPTLKSWSVLPDPFIQAGGSWTLRKFSRLFPSGVGSVEESESLLLMPSGSHSFTSQYHTGQK